MRYFRKSLLLLILLFSVSDLYSTFTKISSSIDELIIEYRPELIEFQETSINGEVFCKPIINNSYNINKEIGSPQHFVENVLITVPSQFGYAIKDVQVFGVKTYQKKMLPVENQFSRDGALYNSELISNNRQFEWVWTEYLGISRRRNVANVIFTAARYNPENSVIEIPEKIIVKIAFNYSQITKNIEQDSFSPKITINQDETRAFVLAYSKESIQSQQLTDLNQVSNGKWLRLTINEEGLYKIDAAQLSSRGVKIEKELINTIKIFGHGGDNLSEKVSDGLNNDMSEIPIIVKTNSNGELESIIFYGNGAKGFKYINGNFSHYRNDFSFNNYYLFTYGGREGKRLSIAPNPEGQINYNPDYYYHRIFYNEETTNPYPDGSGRTYLGRSYFSAPFMDILYNLRRDENIIYKIAVAHRSTKSGAAGRFIYKQSGTQIFSTLLNDTYGDYVHINRSIQQFSSPASLVGIDNRSVLSIEYSNSNSSAVPYFDFYEIHYPRSFVPIDNEISFFSDPSKSGLTEYQINGFTSGNIIGIDASDPNNLLLLDNLAKTGGMFIFRKEEKNSKPSKYFISSKFKTVTNIESISLENLRGTIRDVDVLVITHSQFIESANEYANYRRTRNNLKVAVVKVDDIYKEFSSCIPDVTAIRDFIAFVYHNSSIKPSFVVLWGDAHYDYRNIQVKSPLYIPMYMNKESDFFVTETSTMATDDYIACVDGDDWVCDVAFGRVPVDNIDNAKTYLKKIMHYESNSSLDNWRTNILLVADDSYTTKGQDGDIHTRQSEELSSKLPAELIQKKVYLAAYPTESIAGGKRRKPGVNKEFISTTNTTGALIFNWIGHGNPRVLAHEEFFERETTIPQLSNYDKLFFVTAATCDFGRFDLVGPRSGAEELIFSKTGGAISVFTATRVVGAYANHALNQKYYQSLFNRKNDGSFPTIGEAAFVAKQTFFDENSRRFLILGDPLIKLNFPELQIVVDSINGISTTEQSSFTIKALSKVEIVARITDEFRNKTINDFQGTAIFTLLDGDDSRSITDEFGINYKFTTQGATLSRAAYKVTNGIMKISFVVPKDISFNENNSRMFIYAFANDRRTATGSYSSIKVYGIEESTQNDGKGPNVQIYLDNYNFRSGDVVRREPLLIVELRDETGINSTGLGIGHNIEGWIDDNPVPINLTPYFNTSIENYNSGIIKYYLAGLEPGLHKIRVRAWDVFNNPGEAETYFRIPEEGEIQIFDVLLYPNPFTEETKIAIKHNFTPPFNISLRIYNSMGQVIREIEQSWTSQYDTLINWDGRDDQGKLISIGSYYYYLRLSNLSGKIEKSGILGIKLK